MVVHIFILLLVIISAKNAEQDCDPSNTNHDYKYYPYVTIQSIKVSESDTIDNTILNAMLYDYNIKKYGIAVIDPGDSILMQESFFSTYDKVKRFFDNTTQEYKNSFIRRGYFPFGHEKYGMKSKMIPEIIKHLKEHDSDYINSSQVLEPIEAFYIFNRYKYLNHLNYNPNRNEILDGILYQNIPKEFYFEGLALFYELHLIFVKTMELASLALGLNRGYLLDNNNVLYNGYTHALKFAHYLPFGVKKHFDLNLCEYPIRYDAHYDVGVVTLQKLVDVQRGFQILVDNKWYNVDATGSSNAIVVLNGRHMEYWTNGYWKSSIHRVLSDRKARLPFLYFTQSDEETIVQPIKDCIVCNSSEPNIEYKDNFGKTINQFIKEWGKKK